MAIDTLHPTTFVIFGATGDLFQKKIIPALFRLYIQGELPTMCRIVAFARKDFTDATFREFVRPFVPAHTDVQKIELFLQKITYSQGQFDDLESYKNLATHVAQIDTQSSTCTNKLLYLAVPPQYYKTIFGHISEAGLTIPCGAGQGWTRVLVEKPFGNDIQTAQELDETIAKLFQEKQVFIIDHYLAKEPMQNILAFRFLNTMFEPIWNKRYIASIDINLFEKNDVATRGSFYDGVGALRDVGQNHMLQMLAMVTMEKPETFDAVHIRHEREKVMARLGSVTDIVRAQYQGFTTEAGVKEDSLTETFFSFVTTIDNDRFRDVPIRLTAGKALNESKAEIVVHFKENEGHHNSIVFRIQPHESIMLNFVLKMPGFRHTSGEDSLQFAYKNKETTSHLADAYEKVLFDAIVGDQTLFASPQEIKASWSFVTPLFALWNEIPMNTYPKGSNPVDILSLHTNK